VESRTRQCLQNCRQSVSQFRRGSPALTPPSRWTAPRSPHDRMAVRFVCPCVSCVSRMVPVPPGVFLPVRSGAAAVESAADSVVSRSRGCVGGLGWL